MLRFAAIGLLLASCGGDPAVELVVELRSDFVPGCEVRRVELSVTSADRADPRSASRPLGPGDDLVSGVRVAELRDLSRGSVRVDAVLRDAAGELVWRRSTELELNDSFALALVATRDCAAAACPGSGDPASHTECVGGRCVAPTCHPSAIGECGGADCDADADCTSTAECARGRCTGGFCIHRADGTACGTDEVCHPDAGCTTATVVGGVACPADADADGDGVDGTIDCDDSNPAVGVMAERVCNSACAVGIERCVDGVWGACDAPSDCSCTSGDRRTVSCTMCGMQAQRCVDGGWIDEGGCADQGACSPGVLEVTGPCGLCGMGTRTCDAACAWQAEVCPACSTIGAPCAGDGSCLGGTTCVMTSCGMGTPTPSGICTYEGCGSGVPCPSGSDCITGQAGSTMCVPLCGTPTDCALGWACRDVGVSTAGQCSPFCSRNSECRAGQTCDSSACGPSGSGICR